MKLSSQFVTLPTIIHPFLNKLKRHARHEHIEEDIKSIIEKNMHNRSKKRVGMLSPMMMIIAVVTAHQKRTATQPVSLSFRTSKLLKTSPSLCKQAHESNNTSIHLQLLNALENFREARNKLGSLGVKRSSSPLLRRRTLNIPRYQKEALYRMNKTFLTEYLDWHRIQPAEASRLIYRLRGSQPGLGDRFVGLINAYIHAFLSERVLLVDWQEPFPLEEVLASHGAKIHIRDWREDTNTTYCTTSICNRYGTALNTDAATVIFNATSPLTMRHIFRLSRRGRGMFARSLQKQNVESIPTAVFFGEILHALFRPTQKFEAFVRKQAGNLIEHRYIGVHARLGTGVREGGPRFRRLKEDCLSDLLWSGARRALNGTNVLFLATDTPRFRERFKQDGPPGVEVVYGYWETKHVGSMRRDNCRDRELFWVSVMEILLLGRADVVVGLPSRFAWVGAWFGQGGVVEMKSRVCESKTQL